MYVSCPRCSAYVRAALLEAPNGAAGCGFCGARFRPSPGQARILASRVRRVLDAEARRERLFPVDVTASLAVFAVTVAAVFGLLSAARGADPFASPSLWLFTGWIAVLAGTAWALFRSGPEMALPALYRTAVVMLVVLLAPVFWRPLETVVSGPWSVVSSRIRDALPTPAGEHRPVPAASHRPPPAARVPGEAWGPTEH